MKKQQEDFLETLPGLLQGVRLQLEGIEERVEEIVNQEGGARRNAGEPPKCNWWEPTCTDELGRIIHPLQISNSTYKFISEQVKAGFNRGMIQDVSSEDSR
ncbi:MAG: hypothetical protein ACOX63_02920 [Christensenellales bacterium]